MITCIVIDDEPMARQSLENHALRTPGLMLLGAFESTSQAFDLLRTRRVDVIFSDIEIPDLNGIQFLKSMENPPLFVFVTGYPEYAAESFALDVVDYILKPYDYARFLKAVDKVTALLNDRNGGSNPNFLVIKDRTTHVILRHEEIYYIQAQKDYSAIVVKGKKYMVLRPLSSLEDTLSGDSFIRVQKSFIINLGYVKEVTLTKLIMKGNIPDIPLGTSYRKAVFAKIGI